MAVIEFPCPECGAQIKAPENLAGKTGRCPGCQASVRIPRETGEPEPELSDEAAPAPVVGEGLRRRPMQAEDLPSRKPGLALTAAGGAAFVGALVWAGISLVSGYEVGYMAWATGLLVGATCCWAGGRGKNMATACAGLALAAILIGKLLSTQFAVESEVDELVTEFMTPAAYEEAQRDARDFVNLPAEPSIEEIRTFMFEHNFTAGEGAGAIPEQDVREFVTGTAPQLRAFAAEGPSYGEWRDAVADSMMEEFSLLEAVSEGLSGVDALFAFFGITTAFGVVMARSRSDLQQVPARRRRRRNGGPTAGRRHR